MPLSFLMAMLLVDAAMNAQESGSEALPPLPSAVRCAALFAVTHETLSQKSGDPAMTAGFAEDAAALRRIVIAGEGTAPDAATRADAAIAGEKKALKAEEDARRARGEDWVADLKPCYRVKALGPRGE